METGVFPGAKKDRMETLEEFFPPHNFLSLKCSSFWRVLGEISKNSPKKIPPHNFLFLNINNLRQISTYFLTYGTFLFRPFLAYIHADCMYSNLFNKYWSRIQYTNTFCCQNLLMRFVKNALVRKQPNTIILFKWRVYLTGWNSSRGWYH